MGGLASAVCFLDCMGRTIRRTARRYQAIPRKAGEARYLFQVAGRGEKCKRLPGSEQRPPENAGSLAAITAGYFRSAAFANLSTSSQKLYRKMLKPVLEAHGHRLVREMPKIAARNIIE